MTALYGNRIPTNFSKLPLAFCNGFTLKKEAFWNRRPILQAGTTINQNIIDFYGDIALNIPVSIRMDQTTNKLQQQLLNNMLKFREKNDSKNSLTLELTPGEILINEGDTSNQDCYILLEGTLAISVKGTTIANVTDSGMPIGEMSFLTGEARSATVTACSKVKLLKLAKSNKTRLLRNHPTITMTILEALVSRLADNNSRLTEMKSRLSEHNNIAIKQAAELERNYDTVVKSLMREAGIKKGNLDILLRMLETIRENLGSRLEKSEAAAVYKMFLDFVEYYRKQTISENIDSIILKENMSKPMQDLF